jgi:hypothetical protein
LSNIVKAAEQAQKTNDNRGETVQIPSVEGIRLYQ